MKIFYSPASPYSAKVRMAAAHAGIALEAVVVDTGKPSAEFLAANPLGKVPTLLVAVDRPVFDSRVITQFLNRESGGRLFPRSAAKRTDAEVLEALADGLCDCLLAHVYERRMRPAEIVHQPWLDRQWEKALRTLDHLEGAPPRLRGRAHCGEIALRAALGYLDLRFQGQWEKGRSKLRRWAKRFDERFPEMQACLPA